MFSSEPRRIAREWPLKENEEHHRRMKKIKIDFIYLNVFCSPRTDSVLKIKQLLKITLGMWAQKEADLVINSPQKSFLGKKQFIKCIKY